MFFYASKIFWLIFAPSNLVAILLVVGAVAMLLGYIRAARRLLIPAAIIYAVCGVLPLGLLLSRPLDDRFPIPDLGNVKPTGIIVLGGGVDEVLSAARGTAELSDSGTRMTGAVALALRFPEAKVVFTGGSASMRDSQTTESETARRLFLSLGLLESRLVFEDKSRNTAENAAYTKVLVDPKPGDTWILVTSAFHMPRSVGIFRKAGFPVIPYPTDYTSFGNARDFRPSIYAWKGMQESDRALREWVGLLAYYLTGKTDALFPGPG